MGCNCGGSVRPATSQKNKERTSPAKNKPREGGPGTPEYYWSGPRRPKQTAA